LDGEQLGDIYEVVKGVEIEGTFGILKGEILG